MKNRQLTPKMIKAFTIYKEGTTTKPITILFEQGQPFNMEAKKAKYVSLGYTVTSI